jgi:hypothetical protein
MTTDFTQPTRRNFTTVDYLDNVSQLDLMCHLLGFSVLRFLDLIGMQPGPHTANMLSKMQHYYARIQP